MIIVKLFDDCDEIHLLTIIKNENFCEQITKYLYNNTSIKRLSFKTDTYIDDVLFISGEEKVSTLEEMIEKNKDLHDIIKNLETIDFDFDCEFENEDNEEKNILCKNEELINELYDNVELSDEDFIKKFEEEINNFVFLEDEITDEVLENQFEDYEDDESLFVNDEEKTDIYIKSICYNVLTFSKETIFGDENINSFDFLLYKIITPINDLEKKYIKQLDFFHDEYYLIDKIIKNNILNKTYIY